jgi:uncharacterized protein
MKITYDPNKRRKTLQVRGLYFEDAPQIFDGLKLEFPDMRFGYGEMRMVTVGYLNARMVIVIWTPRGETRHIISMRKANEKEQKEFKDKLG